MCIELLENKEMDLFVFLHRQGQTDHFKRIHTYLPDLTIYFGKSLELLVLLLDVLGML